MTTPAILLAVVIAAFGALTVRALLDHGYFGLFASHLSNWGGGQLLADLTIACLLICVWMFADAPKRGMAAWAFIAITVAAGSFGPLFYLLVRELRNKDASAQPM